MNKSAKLFLALSSCGVLAIAGILSNSVRGSLFANAEGCQHVGNHYEEKSATETATGIKEYWVCCLCHEHYLTEPSVGTWSDAGVASVVINESDDRYIPMASSTKAIESLDVTGYTSTLTYGKNYHFDGEVTAHYDDGTSNKITSFNVNETNLDRYAVGDSEVLIEAGGISKAITIDIVPADTLKVLMIGNSFSQDTVTWANQIASSMGLTDVKISNLVIGGCSLATHYNNIINDNSAYSYETYNDGWTSKANTKISETLDDEQWDFISIQQVSGLSGVSSTYDPYISYITNYLRTNCINPEVNIIWNMTWAYQQDSTHGDFARYSSDQTTMYNAIIETAQEKALPHVDHLIPNGTTIQNFRTSYIGDNLTRDGFHLNLQYGRYSAGLTMVSSLTGRDPGLVTYKTPSMGRYEYAIAIESARNAINQPYSVTNSTYLEEPQMKALTLTSFTDGYYYNINEGYGLTYYSGQPGKFTCTQLISKDQMPDGSVIKIASGYQIRPEKFAYAQKTKNTAKRQANATGSITITDAWWGDYILAGFNISKTDNTDLDFEEAHNAIQILVPPENYSEVKDVTYVSILDVYTWSSLNPEFLVNAYGQKSEHSLWSQKTTNTFPDWAEVSDGTPGSSEYAFSYPHNGAVASTFQKITQAKGVERNFLFRINYKVDGMTIKIKKGVTFENNGKLYAFDRDYLLSYENSVWYIGQDVYTLGIKNIKTWSSGNPEITIRYPDGAPRQTEYAYRTTALGGITVENSTFSNMCFPWSDPLDSSDVSESILIRVANPTTEGIKIHIPAMQPFTHNGVRYQFDKEYTLVRETSGWAIDAEVDSTLTINNIATWTTTTYNPEISVTFSNPEFRFGTETVVSAKPGWLDVENGSFSNITFAFGYPIAGPIGQCILIRVNDKVDGTKIYIHKDIKFYFNGYSYSFENDYTLSYNGSLWSIE